MHCFSINLLRIKIKNDKKTDLPKLKIKIFEEFNVIDKTINIAIPFHKFA